MGGSEKGEVGMEGKELMEMLIQMREESNRGMKEMREDFNKGMKDIREDFKEGMNELRREIGDIREENRELRKRINRLEEDKMRRNIIIFGIEENEKNYWDLEELIIRNLRKQKITITAEDIDFAYRIGRSRGNVRPVKLGLMSWRIKKYLLANRKHLKGSRIYLEEEMTKEMREKIKELIPIMREKRTEGHHAVVRNGKLIINGKVWRGEEEMKQKGTWEKERTEREIVEEAMNKGTTYSRAGKEDGVIDNIGNKKRQLSDDTTEEKHDAQRRKEDRTVFGKPMNMTEGTRERIFRQRAYSDGERKEGNGASSSRTIVEGMKKLYDK